MPQELQLLCTKNMRHRSELLLACNEPSTKCFSTLAQESMSWRHAPKGFFSTSIQELSKICGLWFDKVHLSDQALLQVPHEMETEGKLTSCNVQFLSGNTPFFVGWHFNCRCLIWDLFVVLYLVLSMSGLTCILCLFLNRNLLSLERISLSLLVIDFFRSLIVWETQVFFLHISMKYDF